MTKYKEIIKLFKSLTGKRSLWQVYQDCIEMLAISIQNSCEIHNQRRQSNEQRYLDIVKAYDKDKVEIMIQIYAKLIDMLEVNPFQDLLGDLYMNLGIGDKGLGQIFTPYSIAKLMAEITCDKKYIQEKINKNGIITIYEPCIGGGANVIALCDVLYSMGINYQKQVVIVGQDISKITAMQAYIVLSLIGCKAVIKISNTLTEPYTDFYSEIKSKSDLWYTPFLCL